MLNVVVEDGYLTDTLVVEGGHLTETLVVEDGHLTETLVVEGRHLTETLVFEDEYLTETGDGRMSYLTRRIDALLSVALHRPRPRRSEHERTRLIHLCDWWAVLLPARIVNEELGDYIEDINRRLSRGQVWQARFRVVTAVFWTGINAAGYVVKALSKKQTG